MSIAQLGPSVKSYSAIRDLLSVSEEESRHSIGVGLGLGVAVGAGVRVGAEIVEGRTTLAGVDVAAAATLGRVGEAAGVAAVEVGEGPAGAARLGAGADALPSVAGGMDSVAGSRGASEPQATKTTAAVSSGATTRSFNGIGYRVSIKRSS